MLICLSLLAAAFSGVTAGLLGVLLFILGLAIGYAIRWYMAS